MWAFSSLRGSEAKTISFFVSRVASVFYTNFNIFSVTYNYIYDIIPFIYLGSSSFTNSSTAYIVFFTSSNKLFISFSTETSFFIKKLSQLFFLKTKFIGFFTLEVSVELVGVGVLLRLGLTKEEEELFFFFSIDLIISSFFFPQTGL